MAKSSNSSSRALLAIPGTLFWVLVLTGIFTANNALIGASVALFLVTAIVAITMKVRASAAEKAELLRIYTRATPARARVIAMSTRGGAVNGHPRIDFELEVSVPGQAPHRVKLSSLVSKLALGRLQPDAEIDVRVDPDDRQRVLLDAALTPYGYE